MLRAGLIVIEAQFVLGRLEAVLDGQRGFRWL